VYTTLEYTIITIVCLVTAVVIQRIYSKEKQRNTDKMAIQGIKWFGLAIFIWGIGALLNLVFTNIIQLDPTHKVIIYTGVLISLANSLFILLSLPSIQHQKKRGILVRLVQRFSTKEFIILYSSVLSMIAFVFIAATFNNEAISNNFIWLIDIPISVVVAFALLLELNKAFSSRKMKFMYFPTFILFLLILVAVTHRIIPQDRVLPFVDQEFWSFAGTITAISFKFLFILLFSILLYSWKFLSEKEQQQSLSDALSLENTKLNQQLEKLILANESHLDTIKRLKSENLNLQESSKIELSKRQKEVLGNLAFYGKNKSYSEIATAMYISLDGFQTHIHQIKKLLNISGAGGKLELIDYANKQNLQDFKTIETATKLNG